MKQKMKAREGTKQPVYQAVIIGVLSKSLMNFGQYTHFQHLLGWNHDRDKYIHAGVTGLEINTYLQTQFLNGHSKYPSISFKSPGYGCLLMGIFE